MDENWVLIVGFDENIIKYNFESGITDGERPVEPIAVLILTALLMLYGIEEGVRRK